MNTIRFIEKYIIWALIIMISIVLVISVLDLVYQIFIHFRNAPNHIPELKLLVEFFSMFLIILIGIELLETIKAYLKDDVIHVEIVVLVAIIAVARKVIILDYDKTDAMTLIGMAALILGLAGAYYLIKRSDLKLKIKAEDKR